jgi:hypothetical protein
MKIDVENPNPGATFYFDENDKKGGHITVRVLSAAKLEEITNKCRQKRIEVKGSPPTRFEYLDFKKGGEKKEFELTWDYCLVGWDQVVDANNQQITCTPENKVSLMRESPVFSTFVMGCVAKINIAMKLNKEDLEGN